MRFCVKNPYSALRRFLPAWYRYMPLCSTTMDETIPAAQAFMDRYIGKPYLVETSNLQK